MQETGTDILATFAAVIRVVENVRRLRKGETMERWEQEVGTALRDARELLGTFGEGKALSLVVGLATDVLMWQDLRQVGVDPQSDPPWMVIQEDLLEPSCWADGERRLRLLKMLKKLALKLEEMPESEQVPEGAASLIAFAEARGVLADTLRRRLHRHNQQAVAASRIQAWGTGSNQRLLYRLEDLSMLLTDEERARS